MVTKKELKDIERRIGETHGWNPLGVFLVSVETKLTFDEKRILGEKMAELIGQIENLEEEKKAFDKKMKDKIDELDGLLKGIAFEHRSGVRIEDRELPGFYDPRSESRHYVDPSTGEIVKSVDAEKGDEQMKLGA